MPIFLLGPNKKILKNYRGYNPHAKNLSAMFSVYSRRFMRSSARTVDTMLASLLKLLKNMCIGCGLILFKALKQLNNIFIMPDLGDFSYMVNIHSYKVGPDIFRH